MILSVGSINMDFVVQVRRAPEAGETVLGSDYVSIPGGKGANQAAAVAKLGAPVKMYGAVGMDAFADPLINALEESGVDTSEILRLSGASGVAFISVEENGQNRIIVAPGANSALSEDHLSEQLFAGVRLLLLQLEIPFDTVLRAAALGRAAGARVVLNAAPPVNGAAGWLNDVDVLVVNEVEAGQLLGRPRADSVQKASDYASALSEYVADVVVTLGSLGAVWHSSTSGIGALAAFPVEVVDTTAAGDAFVGALAVALSEGVPLSDAVRFGSAAGALAVTSEGAQTSLPERLQVQALLRGAV